MRLLSISSSDRLPATVHTTLRLCPQPLPQHTPASSSSREHSRQPRAAHSRDACAWLASWPMCASTSGASEPQPPDTSSKHTEPAQAPVPSDAQQRTASSADDCAHARSPRPWQRYAYERPGGGGGGIDGGAAGGRDGGGSGGGSGAERDDDERRIDEPRCTRASHPRSKPHCCRQQPHAHSPDSAVSGKS